MWALKILHEKNWRVSLCVQELFHPQDFLWILAATPGFQNSTALDLSRQTTGLPVLSWFPLYLVLDFFGWLGERLPGSAANNGSLRSIISSTFELDTGTGGESIPLWSSLSRVSLLLNTVVVGDEDELEEDVGWLRSRVEGVIEGEGWELDEGLSESLEPRSERSSPCCIVSESRF